MKVAMFSWGACFLACLIATEARAEAWKALQEAPTALVRAYKTDKESFLEAPSPKSARFLKVMTKGQIFPLYLVDPNSSSICGSAGCLVVGYVYQNEQYKTVFSVYVNRPAPPRLPDNSFLVVSNKMKQGLPCLDVATGRAEKEYARWCYNGTKYTFNKVVKIK